MIIPSGSKQLNDYLKQVTLLDEFNLKFTEALRDHLKKIHDEYEVDEIEGGFNVELKGLRSDFQYLMKGNIIYVQNELGIRSNGMGYMDNQFIHKEGDITDRMGNGEFIEFTRTIINTALEDQIKNQKFTSSNSE